MLCEICGKYVPAWDYFAGMGTRLGCAVVGVYEGKAQRQEGFIGSISEGSTRMCPSYSS